jgi:thiol-disulfide isomerase/thioredoxin
MPKSTSFSLWKLLKALMAYSSVAIVSSVLTMGWWWGWPSVTEWQRKLSSLAIHLKVLGETADPPRTPAPASLPDSRSKPAKTAQGQPGTQQATPKSAPAAPQPRVAPAPRKASKPKPLPSLKTKPLPTPLDFRKPLPLATSGKKPSLDAVMLLNGGGSASSNYFSHHLHIQMFAELLLRRGLKRQQISIFSSDGSDKKPDQLLTSAPVMSWLYKNLPEYQFVVPSYQISTTLPGFVLNPAKKKPLRRWLRRKARQFRRSRKQKTLLLFVTDHGKRGKNGTLSTTIELWKDSLSVRELRRWLRPFGRRHRVVSVMSQCFSGGFAQLQYTARNRVQGNRCGFFATLATREAYGCFPETATSKRVGYAYRMARAMRTAPTLEAAHLKTMLTDRTPDVPLRTSDVYLRHQLQTRARRRGKTMLAMVDRWLRKALARSPRFLRKERRLLKDVRKSFELKTTQTLATTWKEIRHLRRQRLLLQKLDKLWSSTTSNANRDGMLRFYRKHPSLSRQILKELDKDEPDTHTIKVGRKLHLAYLTWLQKRNEQKKHLQRLHFRNEAVTKAIFRNHVREAAYLRIATLLTQISGLYFLKRRGRWRQRRALRRLLQCERTSLGQRQIKKRLLSEGPQPTSTEPNNPDLKLDLKALIPSFLGIRFRPAPGGWSERFAKLAPGAVQVMGVQPNSPAGNAGLQRGDIVVSIGGQMLQTTQQIREVVMLSGRNKAAFFLVQRNGRFLPPVKVSLTPIQGFDGLHSRSRLPPLPQGLGSGTGIPGLRRFRPSRRRLFSLSPRRLQRMQHKKPTLLFFWATWCSACKRMLPMLRRVQKVYPNVRLIAVTSESRWKVQRFLRDWGKRFPFRTGLDRRSRLHRRFRIASLPTLVLLSRGRRLWRKVGMSSDTRTQLHRQLQNIP